MSNIATKWYPFMITNEGLKIRQRSIVENVTVAFDYAKIGQGVPDSSESVPLMTDIIIPAEKVPVVRSESGGATHYIGVRIDNKNFSQPVLMTEIGIFASVNGNKPVLYGYTYATQGYDSIPAGNVCHYVWTVGIDTVLSRAQNIVFNYDGSRIYATHDDINQHNTSKTAHDNILHDVPHYKVIAERTRDPTKPDYNLGAVPAVLIADPYTGNAPTLIVDGSQYDGTNVSQDAYCSPDGTIIIKQITEDD